VALTDSFASGGTVLTSTDGYSWTNPAYTGSPPYRDIVFGNSQFVAVGTFGIIATSPDGLAWTKRSDCGLFCLDDLFSIAWSGSGYAAVGENGMVFTSSDGTSWTSRATPLGASTSTVLRRVASSGTVFVASGHVATTIKGAIIYSTNGGVTWTSATITPTTGYEFDNVAWDGSRFLATAFGSPAGIWTSTDGASWTQLTTNLISRLTPAGAGYIGTNGVGAILTSSDAVTWTLTYNFVYPSISDILWMADRNEYLAVGGVTSGGFIATSTDAATWNARLASDKLTSVLWDGSKFLAIDFNGRLYTSVDGLSWASDRIIPNDGVLRTHTDIAWSGSRYVVVASSRILSSTDGMSWGNPFFSSGTEFVSVIWSGAEFAAISYNGAIFRSSDGISWPPVGTSIASNASLADLARSSTRYVAVAAGGNVYFSDDGIAWTARPAAAPNNLRSVTWTGSQFVAVGEAGTIVTSADGDSWTNRSIASGPTFNAVAMANTQLVAAANGGRIFVSSNGVSWTEETTDTTLALFALAASPTRVVAMGQTGRIVSRP